MALPDRPADLTSEEERLLELLISYDEALVAGVSPAGATPKPAELHPALADQLLRGQRLLELLATLNPAGEFPSQGSPPSGEASAMNLEALWQSLPDGGALPQQLGRFVILRELGRGGHGVVLLAHDPILKRHVALKLPRPENLLSGSMRRRFVREAQTAARLTHPNLVSVHEVGEIGPICYIASAYCAGPTLAEWLSARSTAVSPNLAARIIEQLAHALQYAHEQNILHRDLKPSNVLLEPLVRGESSAPDLDESRLTFVPKVTDFGLAKLAAEAGDESKTHSGSVLGTPAYMSPEQAEGRLADVGATTDVYALGAILHELLTGLPAFRGGTNIETLHKVLFEEPTRLRRLRRDVPADLEAICRKCLEKKSSARYPSCAALAADLRRFLGGRPTLARPLTLPQRLGKWARRRPAVAALFAVSVLAAATIVAGSSLYTVQLGRALSDSEQRRLEADEQRAKADRHRLQAEVNLDLADKSRQEMIRQQQTTNQFVYGTRMRQTYQALAQGDVDHVRRLMGNYQDGAAEAYLQDFSWQYLARSLHDEQLTLRGHEGQVYAVMFTPDGRSLVSGGDDGTIRIWNPASGQLLRTIYAHDSCTNDLAFSPDGRLLASASCDQTIKLWETVSWQQMATFTGHDLGVLCLAFSPDGRQIASGDMLGHTNIWSLDERRQVVNIPSDPHSGAAQAVAWIADGHTLTITQGKNSIRFIDTNNWKLLSRISSAGSATTAFSPDGRLMANNNGQRIEMRDAASREVLSILPSNFGIVHRAIFSADSRQLFSGDESGLVRIWNLTPEGLLATGLSRNDQQTAGSTRALVGHTGRVQSLALAPDGCTLASASFDGTVRLWDLTKRGDSVPMVTGRLYPGLLHPCSVHLTPDLARLSIVAADLRIVDFDVRTGAEIGSRQIAPANDLSFVFAPNAGRVVAVQSPGCVLLGASSNAADPIQFDTVIVPEAQHLAFSANGRYVATIANDGFIRVRDVTNGTERYVNRHGEGLNAIINAQGLRPALSSDGRLLVVSNFEYGLINLDSGETTDVPTLKSGAAEVNFSPDDSLLAIRCGNGAIQLLNVAERRIVQTLRLSSVTTAVAFTTDNKILAVATHDGHITLWHIASGQEVTSLLSYDGIATRLQFAQDDSALAAVVINRETSEAHLHVWSTRD